MEEQRKKDFCFQLVAIDGQLSRELLAHEQFGQNNALRTQNTRSYGTYLNFANGVGKKLQQCDN